MALLLEARIPIGLAACSQFACYKRSVFPRPKALIIRIAKIGDCPSGDVSRDI